MQGKAARVESRVYWRVSITLGVWNDEIEDFSVVVADKVLDRPVKMRSRKKTHIGVFRVRIVDGQPGRNGASGRDRPVCCVLMPSHPFAVPRKLAEKVSPPCNHIWAQQIRNGSKDSRMTHEVVHATEPQMRRVDRIATLTGALSLRENDLEEVPQFENLVLV